MEPGDHRQRVAGDRGRQEEGAAFPDPAVGQLASEDRRGEFLPRVCVWWEKKVLLVTSEYEC